MNATRTDSLVRTLAPGVTLHRDRLTGVAWVEDANNGLVHGAHPSISRTGRVSGMVKKGYWRAGERTVAAGRFIYNIDRVAPSTDYDRLAREECDCASCRPGRQAATH